MKKSFIVLIAVLLAATFAFTVAYAQDMPAAKTKAKTAMLSHVDGIIQSINKDTSTINVKERKSGVIRQVVYNDATVYTTAAKMVDKHEGPAKLDDLKEGMRIIAQGKFDEKQRLVASRISIRAHL